MFNLKEYILNFSMEMQKLGYVEGEVNAFVHNIVEDRKLSKLSQDEYNEIIDDLANYLMFAKKCKEVF